MRKMTLGVLATLTLATGCSHVKSGLSALGGGKPHEVTVVNNIEASKPQVVIVPAGSTVVASAEGEPVVVTPAPAPVIVAEPVPTPLEKLPRPKKSRISAIKSVASGAFAGALLGTAVGYAMDGESGAAKGAAIGAGAGAVGGAAAHHAR